MKNSKSLKTFLGFSCAHALLMGASALAGMSPDGITFSNPIEITRGGTYTGNWKSTNPSVNAVTVSTSEPVIIQNCNVAGPGPLIRLPWGGNVEVRNCRGFGIKGNFHENQFFIAAGASRIIVENNYFQNTSGITLGSMGSGTSEIRILKNKILNIDCRNSSGAVGMCNFVGLDKVSNVPNIEIAWNQVINEPNNSNVEDNINFYRSGGSSSNVARVHDNYIQGGYPIPASDPQFSGTGMITDEGGSGAEHTAYVESYRNQFVSIGNTAMSIAAGHDIRYYENRIVASGVLPDGSKVNSNFAGMQIASYYGPEFFYNNSIRDQTAAYVTPKYSYSVPTSGRNDYRSDGACAGCGTGITHLPSPVTKQSEFAEWNLWGSKLTSNGIAIGVNGEGTGSENVLFAGLTSTAPVPTSPPSTPPVVVTPPAPGTSGPVLPTPPGVFYRAINFNGPALSLDSHSWEAESAAANLSVSNGNRFENQNVSLQNAPDAARSSMIRSSIWGSNVSATLTAVPNAEYQVYVYAWEDNNSETYSLNLNGSRVVENYVSGSAGAWKRHGPLAAQVTSGSLQLVVSGGAANLSGIEIYKTGSVQSTQPVTPPALPPAPVVNASTSIVVRAAGTIAGGIYAHFVVKANGTKIGEKKTTAVKRDYSFSAPAGLGRVTKLEIIFDNDAFIANQDRNLLVDFVKVNGVSYSSEASNVKYDIGSPGGSDIFPGDSVMGSNGTLIFTLPSR
ncbi:MAG: hypothetical protein H7301_00440 [Cryobacterium sp.]|nr:hypothetical protein [Oligoflexia bacterium]